MTINDRIADAITRHGPDSPSGQAHTDRGAYLLAVADRVDHRLSARPDHPYQHAKYFRPTPLLDSPLPGWPGPSVNAIIKAPNDCTPARRPEIGLVLKPKSNRTSFARRAQRRAMPAAARNKNRSQPAMTMTRTCTDDTAQPDGAVAPHPHRRRQHLHRRRHPVRQSRPRPPPGQRPTLPARNRYARPATNSRRRSPL